MKFTGQFVGAGLDLRAWIAALHDVFEIQLNELTRSWITAVTGRVPVWSGMAQASLLSVVELVNSQLVITPKSGVSSRILQGKTLGSAEKNITSSDFTITITTDVPHYSHQEYHRSPKGGSPSAPWRSQLAGKNAFELAAKNVQLPPVILTPVVKIIS